MNYSKEALTVIDKKYVWHPFTQMKDWMKEDNIMIERGEGCYLIDSNGNRYLDGVASLWTNVHGHNHPLINQAVKEQIDMIAHSTFLGLSNIPATVLAEKLVAIVPQGLRRVFYSDSGSEAVEIALKVAYQYWCQKKEPQPQKKKFVHLQHSYHGDTIGSVSVGGIDLFHTIYKPFLFETIEAPAPYCYRCPLRKDPETCSQECFSVLKNKVKENADQIAAIVIEPVMQGAAGMIVQPPGFLQKVRELATKYNVLLICDEVATGFGRTGKMFACEWENVSPDIMALGKGITGGYLPLAATLFTEDIFNAFLGEHHEHKTFYHGHTYTGNQLASRAAVANLDVFQEEKTLAAMANKISLLEKKLMMVKELEHVGDIRRAGFMVGIELVKDKQTKEPYSAAEKIGIRVIENARAKGVIIRPLGNVIVLMPPLSMNAALLEKLVDVVCASIKEITEE